MSKFFVSKSSPVTPGAKKHQSDVENNISYQELYIWLQHRQVKRWKMTLLPFTKAMFSPLPTLFFTLLTNLWDRNTRGWSIHWNTLEEHFFASCSNKLSSKHTRYLALKTTTYRTGPRLRTKNKEMGDRQNEKNTCIQLHRQTRRPGCDSKKGKKNRAWNPNKKKERKETAQETKT